MRTLIIPASLLLAFLAAAGARADDLSYQSHADIPDQHFACLMAYPADKTGDHATAVTILERCVHEGNVWSMIYLAMLYENGNGMPKSLERSAALMKRGADMRDPAGYSSLARYHWGRALWLGHGTPRDEAEALRYLRMARHEGIGEADEFLRAIGR